jgi:hypothetical protein
MYLERERTHVLDEKSIPASKIEVSWTMDDSIPHSVPTRFLLGSYLVPRPMNASKIGPLEDKVRAPPSLLCGVRMHTVFLCLAKQ